MKKNHRAQSFREQHFGDTVAFDLGLLVMSLNSKLARMGRPTRECLEDPECECHLVIHLSTLLLEE